MKPISSILLVLLLTPLARAQEYSQVARGHLLAPKAFRAAAEKVQPSVVAIQTLGGIGGAVGGIGRQGYGSTTGLIVSPEGLILTSTFTLVGDPKIITVQFPDGSRKVARLLGRDNSRQICLLKVEASDLPVPATAPRRDLRVGQWAVAVGLGWGKEKPALSAGIISATHRQGGKAVQTDASTSPANYGGPLIDLSGRVIGICAPLHPESKDAAAGVDWYDSGIGFAIPLEGLEGSVAAMLAGKTVQPARLGVAVEIDKEKRGLAVTEVVAGSAAEKAGLKKGDILLKIEEQLLADPVDLRYEINRRAAGDKLPLTILRDEKEKQLVPTLDAAEDAES